MSNDPYLSAQHKCVGKIFFCLLPTFGSYTLFRHMGTTHIILRPQTVILSLNGITACVPGVDSYRWNYFSVCSTWMADLISITGIQQQLRLQKMLSTLWLSMLLFAATGDNNIKVLSA